MRTHTGMRHHTHKTIRPWLFSWTLGVLTGSRRGNTDVAVELADFRPGSGFRAAPTMTRNKHDKCDATAGVAAKARGSPCRHARNSDRPSRADTQIQEVTRSAIALSTTLTEERSERSDLGLLRVNESHTTVKSKEEEAEVQARLPSRTADQAQALGRPLDHDAPPAVPWSSS